MKKFNIWIAISVIGIAVIVSFWFLPVISILGVSKNMITLLIDGEVKFGLVGILGIIGMVVTVFAGFMKDRKKALIGSIVSTVVSLSMLGSTAEAVAQAGFDMYETVGYGLYVAIILSIINIVFASIAKKWEQ